MGCCSTSPTDCHKPKFLSFHSAGSSNLESDGRKEAAQPHARLLLRDASEDETVKPMSERFGYRALDYLKGFAMLIVAALILSLVVGIYGSIDRSGFIPHTATVDLYMKGEWLVGENRQCQAFGFWDSKHLGIKTIFCPGDAETLSQTQTPHNLAIKFWGRIERPDADSATWPNFEWRCTRQSDGFTCYALN